MIYFRFCLHSSVGFFFTPFGLTFDGFSLCCNWFGCAISARLSFYFIQFDQSTFFIRRLTKAIYFCFQIWILIVCQIAQRFFLSIPVSSILATYLFLDAYKFCWICIFVPWNRNVFITDFIHVCYLYHFFSSDYWFVAARCVIGFSLIFLLCFSDFCMFPTRWEKMNKKNQL